MSLLKRRWQIFKPEPELSYELASKLNISPITSQVLINRGIQTTEEADNFLKPRLNSLYDPFDIPGMTLATKRVLKAKEIGEKVVVYGDYDVDGVTGTAILLLALEHLGIKAGYYIPHRYKEGYGLNKEAVEKLYKEGVNLILTVDCGISNLFEIELANSLGMEVVVTDHHNLPTELPPAFAIVNPKLIKGRHPSKDLSGAGVAFKFAWGLFRIAGVSESNFLLELLDLAGLGTISDVVPLTQENRILAIYGLKSLNERKRLGLKKLIETAGISGRLGSWEVNFAISPRLNAAGRLEHASLSVDLILSKDEVKAQTLAARLSEINSQRQSIGSQIQEETILKLNALQIEKEKLVVLSGNGWHPGVIGIVASQLVDRYHRPAILIGVNDGIGRGSARSVEDLDIFELLNSCRDLFDDFGGHKGAAGFEISSEKISELILRLQRQIDGQLTQEKLIPRIKIDAELEPKVITMSLAAELETLDPHGLENPPPCFMTQGLKMIDSRKVGSGSHLKARFSDGKVTLEAIGFDLGFLLNSLNFSATYDIAYNLEINEWGGFESAQLSLVDLRESIR